MREGQGSTSFRLLLSGPLRASGLWRPYFFMRGPLILFPDTASALVDELDRMFPEQPATPKTSREEDLAHGAKRDLILFLKQWRSQSREARPTIVRRSRR